MGAEGPVPEPCLERMMRRGGRGGNVPAPWRRHDDAIPVRLVGHVCKSFMLHLEEFCAMR